ncbi:hypothetical protein D3228_09850 [Leucobacter luti]|nr:hypothetical protein [Leucobacter luti]
MAVPPREGHELTAHPGQVPPRSAPHRGERPLEWLRADRERNDPAQLGVVAHGELTEYRRGHALRHGGAHGGLGGEGERWGERLNPERLRNRGLKRCAGAAAHLARDELDAREVGERDAGAPAPLVIGCDGHDHSVATDLRAAEAVRRGGRLDEAEVEFAGAHRGDNLRAVAGAEGDLAGR